MTYDQLIRSHGPSAYWRLNEPSGTTAVDVIGGVNGTISGGVTLGQTGPLSDTTNRAMLFDGTTGKILTTATLAMPLNASIEAWIKFTDISDFHPIFSSRNPLGAPGTIAYGTNTDGRAFAYMVSGFQVNGASLLNTGTWRHIVFVLIAGTSIEVYVDGVLDATTAALRSALVGQAVSIGFDTGEGLGHPIFWPGSIDEVAVYHRAITPLEVAEHYQARLFEFTQPAISYISPGPATLLTQDQIYALPAAKSQLLSQVVVQKSMTLDGTFVDVVGSNVEPGVFVERGYIRSASSAHVVVKKHTIGKLI